MTTKKVVLIVSDDPRHTSGVGNQCRHICKKLSQNYTVVVIGVITQKCTFEFKEHTFDTGETINLANATSYDDMRLILYAIDKYKPSCLVTFTDPYRYQNVWSNSAIIRSKLPIYSIMVWDTYLVPHKDGKQHFNLPIYENCDGIGVISKQSEWFLNEVFTKVKYSKAPPISYVGHGSDIKAYKPLEPSEYADMEHKMLGDKKYDFVALMANRNQSRKKFPDLLEGWQLFMDSLPKAEQDKCAIILHTEPVTEFGTNLLEVGQALAPHKNVYFSVERYDEATFNKIYNLADVCVNVSNAEGFGLTINEAMLAGTPIIANATGGLVDQIGFFDCGIPITWKPEIKRHLDSYGHGKWAYPLFPQRTIIGSPQTPYLYDENCSIDDIARGLRHWYSHSKADREACGNAGRQWAINRGLTSHDFANNVVSGIEATINNFQPKELFSIYKA